MIREEWPDVPFETPQYLLRELVEMVDDGRIQLPDFQRPWKWDDERIVALLATVTRHYPVGVMMALETGGPGTRFKPRPLSGAPVGRVEPTLLLMDGQQRLTSLYQALHSDAPVETMDARKKKLKRWYYIDIAKAIDEDVDREEAIVSVPEDRVLREDFGRGVTYDLSTVEHEAAAGMFPLRLILNTSGTQKWMREYVRLDGRHWDVWDAFTSRVLNNVNQYQIPVIRLTKDTPKEAVCTVFEKVNTGGVPLSVFELVTATYAADPVYYDKHGKDFQLHEDWDRIWRDLDAKTMLVAAPRAGLSNTDFLQAVTLVSTYFRRRARPACKRKDILELPLEDYLEWSPRVVDALHWTAQFLRRQCVFNVADIPYMTQLVALAAIRTVLGEETDSDEAYAKISRWFWCGVFGEQYGGSPETRLPRDLEQVVAWVRDGQEPASVGEAIFREARLDTMRSRNSAAYKGLYALVMRQGAKDWTHNRTPIDESIFYDHQVGLYLVFPKSWCEKNKVPRERYESIVNKTLLAHRTGQLVGQRAPKTYLQSLETDTGLPANWLDDIIATHLIDPAALREEDFKRFYQDRARQLRLLIEKAMGKEAIPAAQAPESPDDYESDPELVA
ncbi:GmrSD restriction endonuclease domain-containing protein [Actinomadura nitritigenes]|uniref:GmrSD restriction endonuclease domain-containing protein n=1 Tax=Actinomadura nitritigenes TaxID=134602 RepID=UPI003D8A7538